MSPEDPWRQTDTGPNASTFSAALSSMLSANSFLRLCVLAPGAFERRRSGWSKCSVWTRDVDRSLRVAQAIEFGTVWINDWAKVYDGAEEGGFKQSGLGRLNGFAALDDFVEYKHIALAPGRVTA